MKRGTKPKPTKLKQLEGDIHKERWNLKEPQPQEGKVYCPAWLDEEARKEWRRITPELKRLGLLTVVDRVALAGYCQAYSRWRRAEETLQSGFTYEFTDKDFKTKRTTKPEVAIARDALNQVKAFLVEFGMTPSSRTRIIAEPPKVKDPMEELLNL